MRRHILVPLFALLFACTVVVQAQVPEKAPASKFQALDVEAQDSAVVLLAVGDIIGSLDRDPTRRAVVTVQREIAKSAVEIANIVVFVDEYRHLAEVRAFFQSESPLKAAAAEGRLLFAIVPHDTQWVRDYGPQVKSLGGPDFIVIDPRYEDTRRQLAVNRERKNINQARRSLCEQVSRKQKTFAEVKDNLLLLQQFDEVFQNDLAFQRINDDLSPYEMMQVATSRAEIKIDRTKLSLDGGNLLRLHDGLLITTSELFLRNRENENTLTAELTKLYGAKLIVYLDPLPGPVIKHADMFVLPAVNNRVLIASYEIKTDETPGESRRPRTMGLPENSLNDLNGLASQAMKKNKQILVDLGYEVVDVPALAPVKHLLKVGQSDIIYYPTLLNALTLRAKDGSFRILVPDYPDLDRTIQITAREKIRQAFGDQAKVIPIDCTPVAWQQGAVHCLTATVPFRISRFATGTERGPPKTITER